MLTRIALRCCRACSSPLPHRRASTAAAPEQTWSRSRSTPSSAASSSRSTAGRAPVTTANFLRYVDAKRFDGQTFYRAMKIGDGGLIQGGVRSDARKLFPPIAHEPTSQTGLKNVAGAIVMANGGPGTARSDFFILLDDQPAFDAGHPQATPTASRCSARWSRAWTWCSKILDAPVSRDQGRRRDEGPDARARGQDREGRAASSR